MRRHQSRKSNGRFTRNTLENTFGLHIIFCPNCGIGNPWGVREKQPKKCHKCKKSLNENKNKSLEEVYRDETKDSNNNGFNGLKEEDYNG